MLAALGLQHDPHARRGIDWLLAEQEPGGAWFGRWGVNYIYGTGSVVPALVTAGLPASHPAIRRAVNWLESVQNEDGGWGEDLRSYSSHDWIGRGASTASQTAWALLALLAAGERDGAAAERGVRWLTTTQKEDGSWDEPYFTGTGFPRDFSINYHLYRMVFPLTALGRYVYGEPFGGAGKGTDGPLRPTAAHRLRPALRAVRPALGPPHRRGRPGAGDPYGHGGAGRPACRHRGTARPGADRRRGPDHRLLRRAGARHAAR